MNHDPSCPASNGSGDCTCDAALNVQVEQASRLSLAQMIQRGVQAGHIKPAPQYTAG